MAITVLSDVFLPDCVISTGVRGRNIRANERTMNQGGYVSVNIIRQMTLREWDVGIVPMLIENWQAIESVYEVTDAGAYGFLLEDPKDKDVDDGPLTLVSGTSYQLFKRYRDAGSNRYKDRKITRPRSSGFVLKLNGAPMSPSDYTLNATTGRVSIPSAPAANQLSWDGEFYVPVHFRDDFIDWEMVRTGPYDNRLLAGPSVTLVEIRE